MECRENKYVSSLVLYWSNNWAGQVLKGMLFRNFGLATEKALSPLDTSLDLGTARRS